MNHARVFVIFSFLLFSSYVSSQNIQVVDFDDIEQQFQKNDDSVRVINFWATWCVPCVEEMPYFVEAENKYSEAKVKFIFVSLDLPNNIENKVIPFVKDQGMQGEVILLDDPDANSWINKVDSTWSGAIPATVIYKGNDKFFVEGAVTSKKIDQQISQRITNK
ncbi:MAG: TlpA family protein disulfide reductase [Bacteroidales bacterium]